MSGYWITALYNICCVVHAISCEHRDFYIIKLFITTIDEGSIYEVQQDPPPPSRQPFFFFCSITKYPRLFFHQLFLFILASSAPGLAPGPSYPSSFSPFLLFELC